MSLKKIIRNSVKNINLNYTFIYKGIEKPIAVAEYELKKIVPRRFHKQLPTPKELHDLVLQEISISR